jgi:hypothetical protein
MPAGVTDEDADPLHDAGLACGLGKKVGHRHTRHGISHERCVRDATL